MSRAIVLVALVLFDLASIAQGLTGRWTGESIQGRNSRFLFRMDLVEHIDGSVTGTNTISIPGRPHLYAIMDMRGQRHGDQLLFEETVIREERVERFYWCIKSGPLLLDRSNGIWRMHGPWTAPVCVDGRLVVFRIDPPRDQDQRGEQEDLDRLTVRVTGLAPTTLTHQPITAPSARWIRGRAARFDHIVSAMSDSLLIRLHDNRRTDGDTISLYLNGRCVAKRIGVPHRRFPLFLTLPLEQGVNHLVCYAENLGSIPPNTAALSFSEGGIERRIVLASGIHHSEGVIIMRTVHEASSSTHP